MESEDQSSLSHHVKVLREQMGRVAGFAVFDVSGTMIISYLLSLQFDVSFIKTLALLWIIGEGLHIANGVDTPITNIIHK